MSPPGLPRVLRAISRLNPLVPSPHPDTRCYAGNYILRGGGGGGQGRFLRTSHRVDGATGTRGLNLKALYDQWIEGIIFCNGKNLQCDIIFHVTKLLRKNTRKTIPQNLSVCAMYISISTLSNPHAINLASYSSMGKRFFSPA